MCENPIVNKRNLCILQLVMAILSAVCCLQLIPFVQISVSTFGWLRMAYWIVRFSNYVLMIGGMLFILAVIYLRVSKGQRDKRLLQMLWMTAAAVLLLLLSRTIVAVIGMMVQALNGISELGNMAGAFGTSDMGTYNMGLGSVFTLAAAYILYIVQGYFAIRMLAQKQSSAPVAASAEKTGAAAQPKMIYETENPLQQAVMQEETPPKMRSNAVLREEDDSLGEHIQQSAAGAPSLSGQESITPPEDSEVSASAAADATAAGASVAMKMDEVPKTATEAIEPAAPKNTIAKEEIIPAAEPALDSLQAAGEPVTESSAAQTNAVSSQIKAEESKAKMPGQVKQPSLSSQEKTPQPEISEEPLPIEPTASLQNEGKPLPEEAVKQAPLTMEANEPSAKDAAETIVPVGAKKTSSMSAGKIVAIVLGAVLGTLLLVGVAFALLWNLVLVPKLLDPQVETNTADRSEELYPDLEDGSDPVLNEPDAPEESEPEEPKETEGIEYQGEWYPYGTYRLKYVVKVREGAGTSFDRLNKDDLPSYYRDKSNDNGALLAGTEIEVEEFYVQEDGSLWGKTEIGWLCLYLDKPYVVYVDDAA